MKVLLIGRSRPKETEHRLMLAMRRAGHDTVLVDDRKLRQRIGSRAGNAWIRLRAAAFRPDRLLLAKPFDVRPDVLEALCEHVPSVIWYRDLRVPPDPRLVERARHVDTLFLTAGGQAPEFEALGARRALWLPDAADPTLDFPAEPVPEWECDVAFIGRGYDEERAEWLMRIGRRFRLRVFGPAWQPWAREVGWAGHSVYGRDYARVCASARIVLGLDPSFQLDARVWGYHSNRTFKVIASGGFYLGHASPGLRGLLRDGEHCAWYDDEEAALERIEHYLSAAAERERIRRAGRAYVLAHHTYDHRVHNLLTGAPYRDPVSGETFVPERA